MSGTFSAARLFLAIVTVFLTVTGVLAREEHRAWEFCSGKGSICQAWRGLHDECS